MKLIIEMNLDNDAFNDPGAEAEIARILQELRQRMCVGDARMKQSYGLFDLNGNRVGEARFVT